MPVDMNQLEAARQEGLGRLARMTAQRQDWTDYQYKKFEDEKMRREMERKKKAAEYGSFGSKLKRGLGPALTTGLMSGLMTGNPLVGLGAGGAAMGASLFNDANPYEGEYGNEGSFNIDPYAVGNMAGMAFGRMAAPSPAPQMSTYSNGQLAYTGSGGGPSDAQWADAYARPTTEEWGSAFRMRRPDLGNYGGTPRGML